MKLTKKSARILILLIAVILSFFWAIDSAILKNLSWHDLFNFAKVCDLSTDFRDSDMEVHFLAVGKADCCYVKCKDYNILIDAADRDPNNIVCEYLHRMNVKKLDYVFVSHLHRDHIGQMEDVIKNFEIGKFIKSKVLEAIIPTSVTYERMLRALISKNVCVKTAISGEKFSLGDLKFEIYGPITESTNINNTSLVFKMSYQKWKFLFTGDAQESEEVDILKKNFDIRSTVLKVGHHGSKTSTSKKFLNKVNPKYAVISVAPDRNNLPKEQTLYRLDKIGAKIYRTDLDGNIIFSIKDGKMKVFTEKERTLA